MSDCEDEGALAAMADGPDDNEHVVLPQQQQPAEHSRRMNEIRHGSSGPGLKSRARTKKAASIQNSLESLLPAELPKACKLVDGAPRKAGFSSIGIVKGCFGTTLNMNMADGQLLACSAGMEKDSTTRCQTVVSDCIRSGITSAVTAKLDSLKDGSTIIVKTVWDEATIRLSMNLDQIRALMGTVAEDFQKFADVLPNGMKRRSPTYVGQIYQSEADSCNSRVVIGLTVFQLSCLFRTPLYFL